MLNQVQPNPWSCLPTAFATATHIKVEDLIQKIGHDGSEIVFPKLPDPLCRRAFHPQECMKAILGTNLRDSKIGFVTISKEVTCFGDETNCYTLTEPKETFDTLMLYYSGVLVGTIQGRLHAAAWDHKEQLAYDPCGFIYPKIKYDIYELYLLANLI